MNITIEKRTRALITDVWGSWTVTTDVPPYVSTDLVEYRTISDEYVQIDELTSNVQTDANYEVTGEGVFDKIMETLNSHITAQYKAQRIRAQDVATVYVGVVPTALTESIKFLLQRKISSQNLRVSSAQEDLYKRQTLAFDDNKLQKVLDSQLNYNGMVFQDAANPDVLNIALENKVNDVFNKLMGLDPVVTPMPEA